VVTNAFPIAARRDADDTRERFLRALEKILVREGLAAVGVNALAREAGADKVLIYRYFGDLNGLYRAFAERADFWYVAADLLEGVNSSTMTYAQAIKHCLRRHAIEIRRRPVTLAVLAAEPASRTPLVAALEEVRERRALEVARVLNGFYARPADLDLGAVTLVLSAAINYLAARSLKIRMMSGVPIVAEKDWARLMAAVDRLVDGVFPPS